MRTCHQRREVALRQQVSGRGVRHTAGHSLHTFLRISICDGLRPAARSSRFTCLASSSPEPPAGPLPPSAVFAPRPDLRFQRFQRSGLLHAWGRSPQNSLSAILPGEFSTFLPRYASLALCDPCCPLFGSRHPRLGRCPVLQGFSASLYPQILSAFRAHPDHFACVPTLTFAPPVPSGPKVPLSLNPVLIPCSGLSSSMRSANVHCKRGLIGVYFLIRLSVQAPCIYIAGLIGFSSELNLLLLFVPLTAVPFPIWSSRLPHLSRESFPKLQ